MNSQKRPVVYVGYGILILAAYLVQFTPLMPRLFGAYPMPLLMVTVIAAMFERDMTAGIIGLCCGALSDIHMLNGSGLHAILYMFAAVIISLLVETLLQNNLLGLCCVSAVVFAVNSLIELVTKSGLTSGFFSLYIGSYFRSAVLSFVFTVPLYYLIGWIFGYPLRYKRPVGVINSRLKKYRADRKKRGAVNRKGY